MNPFFRGELKGDKRVKTAKIRLSMASLFLIRNRAKAAKSRIPMVLLKPCGIEISASGTNKFALTPLKIRKITPCQPHWQHIRPKNRAILLMPLRNLCSFSRLSNNRTPFLNRRRYFSLLTPQNWSARQSIQIIFPFAKRFNAPPSQLFSAFR